MLTIKTGIFICLLSPLSDIIEDGVKMEVEATVDDCVDDLTRYVNQCAPVRDLRHLSISLMKPYRNWLISLSELDQTQIKNKSHNCSQRMNINS